MNDQIVAIRQMLAEQGLPMTAENLNRAMLALARNQPIDTNGADTAMERTITRSMQPRASSRRNPPGPPTANAGVSSGVRTAPAQEPGPPGDEPEAVHNATEERTEDPSYRARGAQIAAGQQPGGRRAGTINGATRINEDDPTAGMFAGTPGRQADETGIDQMGLGMAMLAPFAAAATLPGTAPAAIAAPAAATRLSPMQQAFTRGPGRQADTLAEGARQRMSPVRDSMINRARARNKKPASTANAAE